MGEPSKLIGRQRCLGRQPCRRQICGTKARSSEAGGCSTTADLAFIAPPAPSLEGQHVLGDKHSMIW